MVNQTIPLNWFFLYSHHLSAWQWNYIARRNYLLVTNWSERVKLLNVGVSERALSLYQNFQQLIQVLATPQHKSPHKTSLTTSEYIFELKLFYFNPLNLKSDQHQISPLNTTLYKTANKDRTPQDEFALTTSSYYLYRKCVVATNENLTFDLRV